MDEPLARQRCVDGDQNGRFRRHTGLDQRARKAHCRTHIDHVPCVPILVDLTIVEPAQLQVPGSRNLSSAVEGQVSQLLVRPNGLRHVGLLIIACVWSGDCIRSDSDDLQSGYRGRNLTLKSVHAILVSPKRRPVNFCGGRPGDRLRNGADDVKRLIDIRAGFAG